MGLIDGRGMWGITESHNGDVGRVMHQFSRVVCDNTEASGDQPHPQ